MAAVPQSGAKLRTKKHKAIKPDDVIAFFQQLSTLITAGTPLLRALQVAGEQSESLRMIEVLRKLWAGGWVEHHGEHYDFAPLEMTPAPGDVPIYVGGISDAALRRAARNDGWISDLHTTDELRDICERLHAHRAELGREHEPFAVLASCKDAWDLDGYRRLEEVGVTHLVTQPWLFYAGDTTDVEERVDGIRRFADEVIARH